MTKYVATICHHSIGRAPTVSVGNTLRGAKRRATLEFGDGFLDHTIVIMDTELPEHDNVVATRRIRDRIWSD